MNDKKYYDLKIYYNNECDKFRFNIDKNKIQDIKKFAQEKFNFTEEEIKKEIKFYIMLKDKTEMIIDENDLLIDLLISGQGLHNIIIKKEKKEDKCNCEIKYNILEEKYLDLNKKFENIIEIFNEYKKENKKEIDYLKKKLENEEKNKEKDKKILELNSQIQNKQIKSPLKEKKLLKTSNLFETPNFNINTKKENEIYNKNEIITNPGIIAEIIYDENKMPILLKSQISKKIYFNIKINNIGNCPIPKNCELITKQDKDYNFIILNPKINYDVIEIGKFIDYKLELKFSDLNKVKIENRNYLELSLHSQSFGLISKWIKIYVYLKDDSQNIEKYN